MGAVKEAFYEVVDQGLMPIYQEEAIEWEVVEMLRCVPFHSRHSGNDMILYGLDPDDAWEVANDLGGVVAKEIRSRMELADLPVIPLWQRCLARLLAGKELPAEYDELDTVADAGSPEAIAYLDELNRKIEAHATPGTDLSPLRRTISLEEALVRRGIL